MDGNTIPLTSRLLPEWAELLILFGAIMLVGLLLFGWAFAIRKRKNRIRKYRHHRHRKSSGEKLQKDASGIEELVQQQQGGHRREHHTINPTLAQTGGLPPIREAGEPPAPPKP